MSLHLVFVACLVLTALNLTSSLSQQTQVLSSAQRFAYKNAFPTDETPPLNQLAKMKTAAVLAFCAVVVAVSGHGRLRNPPSRSSAWRDGFNLPTNYNDNELFCGGLTVQHNHNGGKCGICGDPWTSPEPRDNENGGTYGTGTITKTYKAGQVIDVWVELTQNHLGWFEFRVCPVTAEGKDVTQECLNQNILQRADGSGPHTNVPAGQMNFTMTYKLPEGFTCKHCTFQWDWRTGNRWDFCEDGHGQLGCGPQETFRGCADVAIV